VGHVSSQDMVFQSDLKTGESATTGCARGIITEIM
jgi:hypothetical protein